MTQATLSSDTAPRLSWLTTERLAYALLIVIPTLVRMVNLGQRTLAPVEAATALRAWQQAQGMGPTLDAGQPLLFSLQSLHFFVAGATDAAVRFWPLLAAGLIPLALYFARGWLGRGAALLAALLITLSPTINAFARRGDGTAFALLAAGLALAGLARLEEGDGRGWLWASVAMAALLLSGPAGYSAWVILALIAVLTLPRIRPLPRFSLRDALAFVLTLLLGGTAFLVRFDALGLSALNLTAWLTDYSFAPDTWLLGAVRLILDEPLLSLFGLMAVIWGVRVGGSVRTLALAAALASLLAILQGPDVTYPRAVAAFFLALPAAHFILHLARRGDLTFHSVEESLFVVVLVLLAFLMVYALASFAASGQFDRLIIFVVSLLLASVLSMVFIFFIGWREVRAGLYIAGLILTALFSLGTGWSLAFNATLPTLARVYPVESLPDVKDLVRTYGDLSQQQRGDRWALPVGLVTGSQSDDLILWHFRQAQDMRVLSHASTETAPPVLIAPADRELTLDLYAGQSFKLLSDWDLNRTSTTNELVYWLLYRRAPFPPPAVDAVNLWVDLDLLSLQQGE